jgi:hypothetical protein
MGRPRKDAPKRPVQRVFRQAYCTTITLHDGKGKALHTIRYGRVPEGDVKALCEGVCDDVLALMTARPTLSVTALCDSAHEPWGLLTEHLAVVAETTLIHEPIDLWHLLEKLEAAARFHHGASGASVTIARWRTSLLNRWGNGAKIAAEVTSRDQEWVTVGEETPMHEALSLLANHRERLAYARVRREGRPVGSSAVEAICKSLIAVRLKRPGARWKQPSADRIIQLQALALSDRWGDAIELTLEHQRQEVRVAASSA